MIGFIRITERGPTPGQSREVWNAAQKAAWLSDAQMWVANFRAKHFTAAGAAEYKYARRTAKYEADKQRRFGHTRPLEYTGESRQRTTNAAASSTSRRGTVRMNAPALNFRNPKGAANPRLELTTISQREAELLTANHVQHLDAFTARAAQTTREAIS